MQANAKALGLGCRCAVAEVCIKVKKSVLISSDWSGIWSDSHPTMLPQVV